MFASTMLIIWPFVAIVLFMSCSAPVALLATILGGYLILPTQYSLDLPGLPSLNKDTIPAFAALAITALMPSVRASASLPGWLPRGATAILLFVALFFGAVLTVMTNSDTLNYGPVRLPGLRPWDALSTLLTAFATLLPLVLGRRLLSHPDQQRQVLVALTIGGSAYAFLALFEVRMSPQLNNIVYGFFPHAWDQHIRGDGFRPIVFLSHGLWLSIFFSGATLAAFGMTRISNSRRLTFLVASFWLLFVLFLSKSLGALVIALALLPAVFLLRQRGQLIIAAALALMVLVYPMLRAADIIPVNSVVEWFATVSTDRAESLAFRVQNEDVLLDKARERPLFGWGGWGRNFVFNEFGEDLSIADGYWVLVIGQGGWMRYLAEFGLLCIPIVLAACRIQRYRLGPESSLLALVLTGNLIDLIPNATITPVTWIMAGALWGRLERGRIAANPAALTSAPDSRSFDHQQLRPPRQLDDSGQSPWQRERVRPRYARGTTRHNRKTNNPRGTGR